MSIIRDDAGDELEGHGLTFTIGRGTEVVVAAVRALRPLVIGRSSDELFADMGGFWRTLVGDSQLRWIGPEKGVIHLATAAVVNAVWDLLAKRADKPLWKVISDMSPEQQVALVDFRYISDALTPDAALDLGWPARRRHARANARRSFCATAIPPTRHPSAGSGYSDDKVRRLCQRGARRRVDALQDEGRRRRRRRPSPRPDHP